jgi:enoyl-CoA hydratase/carnithine racemase
MAGIEFSVSSGVASLVLDNPPQNRLSTELLSGFGEAVRSIAGDHDIRAVLVRAEGEDFSFGGDISTWLELTPEQIRDNVNAAIQLFNAFEDLPVPIIAAVQGKCLGGGFELALRADVIVAADDAVFGHPEQMIGVVTLLGGIQRVAERAGRTRAMQWALTSELVAAQEMLAAGVITQVVPEAELAKTSTAWAEQLANGPTLAHAGHKQMLKAWANGGIEAADRLIPELAQQLMQTGDARRGIASAQDALRRGTARPVLQFQGR